MTLYEILGGPGKADATIVAVVDKFYERMMRDAEMVRFFSGVDMAKQRAKQATFVTMAFGGPNKYSYRGMNAAHKALREKMGMNDSHFDKVKKHLADTMREDFSVPENLIAEAMAIVETTRNAVMGRAPDAPAPQAAVDLRELLWQAGVVSLGGLVALSAVFARA